MLILIAVWFGCGNTRACTPQADGTWEYKPPCAYDVPLEFNATLASNMYFNKGTMGAKATGEPPKICLLYTSPSPRDRG